MSEKFCDSETLFFLEQVEYFANGTGKIARYFGDPDVWSLYSLRLQWEKQLAYLEEEENQDLQNLLAQLRYWCSDRSKANRRYPTDKGRNLPQFRAVLRDMLRVVNQQNPHHNALVSVRGKRHLTPR